MSHVRKASEAVSEGGSETESVIIFNENVFLAMQDAEISTTTYVKQVQQIKYREPLNDAGEVDKNSKEHQ